MSYHLQGGFTVLSGSCQSLNCLNVSIPVWIVPMALSSFFRLSPSATGKAGGLPVLELLNMLLTGNGQVQPGMKLEKVF